MIIDHPSAAQIPGLRKLWKQAFGDTDAFLDLFFATAFSPERCLYTAEDGAVTAALYWLDCEHGGRKLAYIYAVATEKAHQGRGLCRRLMEQTHDILKIQGYAGSILVPGESELFQMYEKMGYRVCSAIQEFTCETGNAPASVYPVDAAEYARLRRVMLPDGGVVQEGESLTFLQAQGQFYAGEDVLFFAIRDGDALFVPELLGDCGLAPGILAALDAKQGRFRVPGNGRDFAMYRPIAHVPAPTYLGFAFD